MKIALILVGEVGLVGESGLGLGELGQLAHVLADACGNEKHAFFGQATLTVPVWTMSVRGQSQSMLLLHDGVPLLDAAYSSENVGRALPIESIKRIEVVTGPEGALW